MKSEELNFNNNIEYENEKSVYMDGNNNGEPNKSFVISNNNKLSKVHIHHNNSNNIKNDMFHNFMKTQNHLRRNKRAANKNKNFGTNNKLNESNQNFSVRYRIIPKFHLKININDQSMPKKNNNNFGKTVFSKLTQVMFETQKSNELLSKKNIVNLDLEGTDDYNKLTEDNFLHNYDAKPKENNKVISEFLERKKNEQISKRIKMEKKKESISEVLKDLKRMNTLTDRNRSFRSSRTMFKFLQDQKNLEEKHNMLLKKNEIMQKEKENLQIRDRPQLNEGTLNIINKRLKNKDEDIHLRLYNNFNEKKKKEEEKEKEKSYLSKHKEKKTFIKKIEETSDRLFNEYKNKKKRMEEFEFMKENQYKQKNWSFIVNRNSNEIIFNKIYKKMENAFNSIFSKKINEEFDISYDDYLKLLFHIGFTKKNYFEIFINDKLNQNNSENHTLSKSVNINNSNINLNNEYQLVKQLWKTITDSQAFKNDFNVKSTIIIFYILNIIEANIDDDIKHKKAFSNYIKLKNSVNISDINLSHIYKNFHLLRNNAIDNLFIKENDINKKDFSQNKYITNENNKNKKNNSNNKTIDKKTLKIRKLTSGRIEIERVGHTSQNKLREHNQKMSREMVKQK